MESISRILTRNSTKLDAQVPSLKLLQMTTRLTSTLPFNYSELSTRMCVSIKISNQTREVGIRRQKYSNIHCCRWVGKIFPSHFVPIVYLFFDDLFMIMDSAKDETSEMREVLATADLAQSIFMTS